MDLIQWANRVVCFLLLIFSLVQLLCGPKCPTPPLTSHLANQISVLCVTHNHGVVTHTDHPEQNIQGLF